LGVASWPRTVERCQRCRRTSSERDQFRFPGIVLGVGDRTKTGIVGHEVPGLNSCVRMLGLHRRDGRTVPFPLGKHPDADGPIGKPSLEDLHWLFGIGLSRLTQLNLWRFCVIINGHPITSLGSVGLAG